ncbi:YchF/TatD family DNA exonuclease [Rickettsiales endosymbiont of Paramecium tredecaurelia]|nr:TatD family hydrolase [Candidatus Sarmatiella mevalonica]MBL3284369.1 YchF/TatD family DNA exonuclease [Candidatus Sarmatiella mevalonica]
MIDSHCHLNLIADLINKESSTPLLDEEIDALYYNLVERALSAGVRCIQTICTKLEEFNHLAEISQKFDNVFLSLGVHPCNVTGNEQRQQLVDLARSTKKVIGIGETGLDFFHPHDAQAQERSFVEHIIACHILKIPLIVHVREAEDRVLDILLTHFRSFPFTGLIHCFTASKNFAKKVLDLGMYVSISGIVTFKNATQLQEVVRFVPIDRILIETDAPYLAPVPMRGKRNEPSYLKHVLASVASIKNMPVEMVDRQIDENFFSLFNKDATGEAILDSFSN